ncbi:MAG: hypothetical protein ABIN36_11020 [Ferruginibacter sp.]
MVKVKNYHVRNSEDGTQYISLELEGDVAFVQSQRTGRFYATTRRCFMYAAMDESTAKGLIGSQMPGTIERVSTDPYDYAIPGSGEVIQLSYTYQYRPEDTEDSIENIQSNRLKSLA